MATNSFGRLFTVTTWGESHGPALGATIDGCPPNVELNASDLQYWLDRRKPGQNKYTTQRREADEVKILSGMFVNVQFPIENKNQTTATTTRVLVPQSALVHKGQLTGIYTIGTGNVAILRWLRTGKNTGDQVEVLSGLSANEQYIVSAEGKLFNGAKVSAQ